MAIVTGFVMLALIVSTFVLSFTFDNMTHFRLSLLHDDVRTFKYEVFDDDLKNGIDNCPKCINDLESKGWTVAFIEDVRERSFDNDMKSYMKSYRYKILVKDDEQFHTISEKYNAINDQ